VSRDFQNDGLMIEVQGNLEAAIRLFRRQFQSSHVLTELKRRECYLTRTQRRKMKDRVAQVRRSKEEKRRAKAFLRIHRGVKKSPVTGS
jgi:ribosomal protein S21